MCGSCDCHGSCFFGDGGWDVERCCGEHVSSWISWWGGGEGSGKGSVWTDCWFGADGLPVGWAGDGGRTTLFKLSSLFFTWGGATVSSGLTLPSVSSSVILERLTDLVRCFLATVVGSWNCSGGFCCWHWVWMWKWRWGREYLWTGSGLGLCSSISESDRVFVSFWW